MLQIRSLGKGIKQPAGIPFGMYVVLTFVFTDVKSRIICKKKKKKMAFLSDSLSMKP